jgi:hypothetical protein
MLWIWDILCNLSSRKQKSNKNSHWIIAPSLIFFSERIFWEEKYPPCFCLVLLLRREKNPPFKLLTIRRSLVRSKVKGQPAFDYTITSPCRWTKGRSRENRFELFCANGSFWRHLFKKLAPIFLNFGAKSSLLSRSEKFGLTGWNRAPLRVVFSARKPSWGHRPAVWSLIQVSLHILGSMLCIILLIFSSFDKNMEKNLEIYDLIASIFAR